MSLLAMPFVIACVGSDLLRCLTHRLPTDEKHLTYIRDIGVEMFHERVQDPLRAPQAVWTLPRVEAFFHALLDRRRILMSYAARRPLFDDAFLTVKTAVTQCAHPTELRDVVASVMTSVGVCPQAFLRLGRNLPTYELASIRFTILNLLQGTGGGSVIPMREETRRTEWNRIVPVGRLKREREVVEVEYTDEIPLLKGMGEQDELALPASLAGNLQVKSTSLMKNYSTKWYQLHGQALYYFEACGSETPKGRIGLKDASLLPDSSNRKKFQIISPENGHAFDLVADTDDIGGQWVSFIQYAINLPPPLAVQEPQGGSKTRGVVAPPIPPPPSVTNLGGELLGEVMFLKDAMGGVFDVDVCRGALRQSNGNMELAMQTLASRPKPTPKVAPPPAAVPLKSLQTLHYGTPDKIQTVRNVVPVATEGEIIEALNQFKGDCRAAVEHLLTVTASRPALPVPKKVVVPASSNVAPPLDNSNTADIIAAISKMEKEREVSAQECLATQFPDLTRNEILSALHLMDKDYATTARYLGQVEADKKEREELQERMRRQYDFLDDFLAQMGHTPNKGAAPPAATPASANRVTLTPSTWRRYQAGYRHPSP